MFVAVNWLYKALDKETTTSSANESQPTSNSTSISKLEAFTKEKAKQFSTLEANEKQQLSNYLRLGVLLMDTEPLNFWQQNRDVYPTISEVIFSLTQPAL